MKIYLHNLLQARREAMGDGFVSISMLELKVLEEKYETSRGELNWLKWNGVNSKKTLDAQREVNRLGQVLNAFGVPVQATKPGKWRWL